MEKYCGLSYHLYCNLLQIVRERISAFVDMDLCFVFGFIIGTETEYTRRVSKKTEERLNKYCSLRYVVRLVFPQLVTSHGGSATRIDRKTQNLRTTQDAE